MITDFPKPHPDALALSSVLSLQIKNMILAAEKNPNALPVPTQTIPFSKFFDACLYTPNLGYYSNGLRKFGAKGDFITAPELSPIFSYCLANQVVEIASHLSCFNMLEIGAGTGIMCADILDHLKSLDRLPEHYYILERSGTLKIVQSELLHHRHPEYFDRIIWLDTPPAFAFEGIILGNELIDALAVERFIMRADQPYYLEVGFDAASDSFTWVQCQADAVLLDFITHLRSKEIELPDQYVSEFCPQLMPFVSAITENLTKGAMILIDYGYTETAYYHPLRHTGTLIAHYQHRAHEAFFELIGLQDLTANVNFTALAEACLKCDLDVLGFTTQALFLYGLGLDTLLQQQHEKSTDLEWYAIAQKVQQLVLPAEMGERFQVLLLGKNISLSEPAGFKLRDFRHTL